ncbi:hypothetical protein C6N75_10035 [Streptomyces solincola]|uniref:Uncharacterized protein n=1 Tax=Streptomyces solincola TaxID=2100817 RepID=A0A2S9PYI5_9ACTN|nr:hypothetical protein [Streptomyces solincola]PRH79413.1 hypothetical protein C6N75_10035 [Streptomyces solincola]
MTRRGAFLLAVGLIQIILGWSTVVAPPNALAAYAVAGFIGPTFVGIAQIALGTIAVVNAFWPPGKDRIGFMAAFPAPAFWATDAVISSSFGYVAWGIGIRTACFWAGYAALILLAAGMQGVADIARLSSRE